MTKYALMFAAAIACFGFGVQSYAAEPVANAGPDQTVYAWIDNTATVTLDGSDSNDADGDPLTYLWTWSIDGNDFNAVGIAPEIELPGGVHTITLVVNDGTTDSAPDQVVITVVEPLEVRMKFTPRTLNCKSKGRWVKAHIKLPKGFIGQDIDKQQIATLEPYVLPAMRIHASNGKSRNVTVSYDRGTLTRLLIGDANETAEITAVGQLKSGRYFFGTSTFRMRHCVPKPPKENGKK